MPKFYVESGEAQLIADKGSAKEAALDLIRTSERNGLSSLVTVSEQGFDAGHDAEVWFDTEDLVEEIQAFEKQ